MRTRTTRPRHGSRPIRHLVTNDEKEVIKGPKYLGGLQAALRLVRTFCRRIFWGANATMCGMVAIGASAVARDLSGADRRRPRCGSFKEGRRPVMRTLSAALTLVLAMLVSAAWADDKAKVVRVVLVERVQDLQLTDAQEAKIADIRKEYGPKVKEAAKDRRALVKEEVEKIHAVLTAEQKQKLQELKEERKERREKCVAHTISSLSELQPTDAEMTKIGDIREEYRPKIEKAMKELEGLLSDEQKKARDEAINAGKDRREVLAALKLTDAQKEKVVTVAKEVRTLVREEMEKIRDVLTEAQKQKLQELKEERREQVRDRIAHRIENLKELNLTDEQRTKIVNIRKEYRPKVHEAGNKLRASVREELEQIVAVIKE
jgi:Spy/CpxP family protein refolding chaperone